MISPNLQRVETLGPPVGFRDSEILKTAHPISAQKTPLN